MHQRERESILATIPPKTPTQEEVKAPFFLFFERHSDVFLSEQGHPLDLVTERKRKKETHHKRKKMTPHPL